MKVRKKMALVGFSIAAALMLTSCALSPEQKVISSTDQSEEALQLKDEQIAKLESDLSLKKEALKQIGAQLAMQKKQASSVSATTVAAPAPLVAPPASSDSLLPPAKPGECYARILIPAKYEVKSETLLKKAESERIEIIPAKYEWVEKTIQTEDSSFNLIPVSGDFTTKTTQYKTREGRRYWATGMGQDAPEVSAKLLDAAKNSGIDLDAAKVGMCYHEHYIAPKYKIETQKVIAREAYETVQVIPAKYEWIDETVLVKEASFKLVTVPATYKNVTERILVEEAKTIWKKGRGPIERLNHSTGEIVCLIEIPAKYKTITKTVIDTPATTKKIEIPAEYKTVKVKKLVAAAHEKRTVVPATYNTISKKVMVSDGRLVWHEIHDLSMSKKSRTGHQICLRETPPTFASYTTKVVNNTPKIKKVVLPAKHKTIKVRKLVSPAQKKRIKIPAEYQTINKRMKVSAEHMEWVPILCETNFNVEMVSQLQKSLKTAGYDPGVIDGDYGNDTYSAVSRFQKDKGLATGHLTIETLRALGVAY